MVNVLINKINREPTYKLEVEFVERKGLGHPDYIADAVAEAVGRELSKYYLENFGVILHHNVDKVLVIGGQANPRFGGGEIIEATSFYFCTKVYTFCRFFSDDVNNTSTCISSPYTRLSTFNNLNSFNVISK